MKDPITKDTKENLTFLINKWKGTLLSDKECNERFTNLQIFLDKFCLMDSEIGQHVLQEFGEVLSRMNRARLQSDEVVIATNLHSMAIGMNKNATDNARS